MGFLDSLGSTLKSLGGAVAAPVGLVYDLATMPFDNKDDNFGTVLATTAHAGGNVFDPFSNSQTWTGYGFGKTMEGLNWAYKEGVDRPVGTAITTANHATNTGDYGSMFDGDTWAKAYAISKERSAGESFVLNDWQGQSKLGGMLGLGDPLAPIDPLDPHAIDRLKKGAPGASGAFDASALGADLTLSWYTDPGVLVGKAAMAGRAANLGKLKTGDRDLMALKLAGDEKATGIRGKDWSGRFDRYFDYVSGNNHLGRPLNAAEIHAASPELQRAQQGKAIAGLMDDALKLPGGAERKNTLRRIIAVGAGDGSQIDRIKAESDSAHAIVDALKNVDQGTTTRLHLQALKDEVRFDPEFNADFARQLDNLNTQGEIDGFVKNFGESVKSKLDANTRLLDVQGDLNFVPGRHSFVGEHALRVQHRDTIGAKVSAAHTNTIQAARDLANRESYSSVFQKSLYHMPLVVAHPVGLLASPYTKGIRGATTALRQTHFNGVANLHDWTGSTEQLNSMMKVAGVDDTARLGHLSEAYKANSEADKMAAIHRVEHVATAALASRMSATLGGDALADGRKIDPGLIQELTIQGQLARKGAGARTDGGRIYAATKAPDEMAGRMQGYQNALDARGTELAREQGKAAPVSQADILGSTPEHDWHVDQIPSESGIPMAMPLTIAQLGNRVPLFDIHLAKKLTSDKAWVDRFAKLSDAYTVEARDLGHLQRQLKLVGAKGSTLLGKAVTAKRAGLDALVHAGSMMTRWWKYSVLFRLGYPMRVLMDDHMRIASQLHWSSFAFNGMREGLGNGIRNNAPAMIYSGGRRAEARQAFTAARARRAEIVTHFGRDAHTDEEWTALKTAIKDGDTNTVRALDPDGRVAEHLDTTREARSLASAVTSHKTAITRWKSEITAAQTKHDLGIEHGVDIPAIHKKIAAAEAAIVDKSAGRTHLLDQLGDDPEALRSELVRLNMAIDKGVKGFAESKIHLGMRPVKLDRETTAAGVYGPGGAMYREEAGSREHYTELLTDGEDSAFNLISSGAHRTIQPGEDGHLHVWANVLNHQFQHSPELMSFVRGKVETPQEFAKWVGQPEQAYIRNRMRHFAHDPEDWGSRLQELYHDYVPTPALREAVKKGSVSARKLDKLFPDAGLRPAVHGQLANVNTGRHTATRLFSDAANRMFRVLSEVPTDHLSRHPYMNAMYKQELRELYAARKTQYAREGKEFTQDDLTGLERQARIKALGHLKRTLWDVSAHSHAAHAMRFLSPFFAAHQEALTRWWRIATDDPSIVRKFQLAFDAPRKAGLTYDPSTGQVEPGEGISMNHQILLRVPFAGDNSAVNKWVKKMGGGKYWHVNENGFNLILQNGIANPGVGPVVTVPMESLVNKYANEPEIEKMARVLNPYPPDSPLQAVQPAWSKRVLARIQGPGNKEWGRQYNANLADAIIQFRNDHGEKVPTEIEFEKLAKRAGDDTNRDIGLMALSNIFSPLPAKPNSKYTLHQQGVSRIMAQMKTGGHDFTWARDQVREQYGDIYTALLYSQSTSKAHLVGTPAEVGALERNKALLGKTDPSLARMIIGPAAAMGDDPEHQFSSAARRDLTHRKVSPTSSDTYVSSKDPTEAGVATMVDAGWTQYEQLTNWLQVQAEAQGLNTYDESDQLVAAKRAGVQYLLKSNYAWAHEWNQFDHGTGFTERLTDMEQIASDPKLTHDPTRSDVHWLGEYLSFRKGVTQILAARKAAGGAGTITANGNEDLAKVFATGVQYMRQNNTLFDTYMYHGIIERDPYLFAAPDGVLTK